MGSQQISSVRSQKLGLRELRLREPRLRELGFTIHPEQSHTQLNLLTLLYLLK